MRRKDWLLLAIDHAGDRGLSPVQLQKSLFLLGEKRRKSVGAGFYQFEPHNYGPFSSDIYADADRLDGEGHITKSRQPGYSWSKFYITDAGRKEAARLRDEGPEPGISYLDRAVDWVKQLPFDALVRSIYEAYPRYRVNSVFRD